MIESNNEKREQFSRLGLKAGESTLFNELIIPVLLMSTIGAFYWAVRGSSGYGGMSGGIFAGLGWALAWFFLSYERSEKKSRPYSSGWIVLAIVLGIGIGGMHGYGQFMSWIKGEFYLSHNPDVWVPINPMIGFLWLFQCGLAWGGITGLFMGMCSSKKPLHYKDWILRLTFGIVGGLIACAITIFKPEWINPLYGLVDYGACPDCVRTLSISLSSMIWIGVFLGLFFYEVYRKEWRNVKLALVMGLGFALAFSICAFWHFGPNFSTLPIDWWKNWEMSIGFVGGVTFGISFYLYNRSLDNSKLKKIRFQPYSLNRNTEKIIGVELAILLALGWSIFNGIGGLIDNFSLDQSLRLLISLPIISIILIYFVIQLFKTVKTPYRVNDGRLNIQNPALRFFIVHLVLVLLGYMVSFNPSMKFANWFLIWIYSILLIIGGVFFMIRIRTKKSR